jgi:hypothetical protein
MSGRDELVEAGAQALALWWNRGKPVVPDSDEVAQATIVINAVEPLIRARVAEDIAQAIDAQRIPSARDHGPEAEAVNDGLAVAWRVAREVAEEATP